MPKEQKYIVSSDLLAKMNVAYNPLGSIIATIRPSYNEPTLDDVLEATAEAKRLAYRLLDTLNLIEAQAEDFQTVLSEDTAKIPAKTS